jgi:formylglycine-generating enzyme
VRALIGVVFGTGLAGLGAVASALDQPKFTRTSQSAPALLCEAYSGTPDRTDRRRGLVWIEGGSFQMGSDRFYPEERPAHQASVDGFWIDRHPVTNAQFGTFVSATGYLTQVERGLDPIIMPGIPDSARVPGSLVFVPPKPDGISGQWRFVPGANWRYPEGPGSSIAGRENHPVVHVTYEDALAYARWAGRELPTEAQFERAARGDLVDADYSWGTELTPRGLHMANTWQGPFPLVNRALDGFEGTSPVGCFPANGYGLFDMGGNVWELTTTWYRPRHSILVERNPQGPASSFDPRQPEVPAKVIKGGSHLCSPDFCWRFRPSARQPQEVFLATSHVGFRTVLNGSAPSAE